MEMVSVIQQLEACIRDTRSIAKQQTARPKFEKLFV